MKYISTFEQFINEKYDLLNESLDEKQWKEKQKEIIKEIQTFGKQIASLIKKASSDKEWEKLLSVVQYFDSDMDADLLWREDYDEDDEELEDIDDENREVFATNLTYGIKEAISEVKSISLEDWNELTQEDWMDEEGMYGAYLKARRNAISKKLIKEQYINEKYNILNESSKISWDKKQGLIMVGRKKVDPFDIDIENFNRSEMWLEVDLKSVKGLNKKEEEDLHDWVTGAYDDSVQDLWYEMFGDRL